MVLEQERTQVAQRTDARAGSAGGDILEDEAARFMGRLVRKRDGRVCSLRSLTDRPRGRDGGSRRAGHAPSPIPSPRWRRHRWTQSSTPSWPSLPEVDEGEVVATVEAIQDEVERALMAAGAFAVARRYIVYREARARRREEAALRLRDADGQEVLLNLAVLRSWIAEACAGLRGSRLGQGDCRGGAGRSADRRPLLDLERSIVLAARTRIETRPGLLVRGRAGAPARHLRRGAGTASRHRRGPRRLSPCLPRVRAARGRAGAAGAGDADFDLERLGAALAPERDLAFQYLGLQTLYDRYLIHARGGGMELPQMLWMRVAMGLALQEDDREERAIAFYDLISSFRFCPSTPTLFNAGTRYPQLSSCYLTTVSDDLGEIFKAMRDNALLSKWSGGIGNDWTPVRALGSHIKGTNGASQGVVPFLKVANDTAIAVNQGGKRKGAVCAYLEAWHLDVEEFLDLRKNTGDDRRRTHDMHTAFWVPDLFMQRVRGRRRLDALQPERRPRSARSLRRRLRRAATPSTKPRSSGARSPTPDGCARSISGGRC